MMNNDKDSIFQRRMTVILALLKHGEKTVIQLLDMHVVDMERGSLNVLLRNLRRDGYLNYNIGKEGEYSYYVTDAFKTQLKEAFHANEAISQRN